MSAAATRGRYDAFISYSHRADRELARNLQRALERIGSPWYRARSLRAFRDETDLTADPKLWPILTAALESADYFVLLASPGAASSQWVNKEIGYWLDELKRPADTILIAVTDGELAWDAAATDFDWQRTTCTPPALRKRFAQEPLAADFRGIESRKLGDPDFTQQAAKLVASIRKLPLRELYDLEMTRYRRRLRLIGATAVVLAALLVIVGWQLVRIQTQSRDALAEALASRSRVEQTSAPSRAAMLAATAVALRDSPRTRAQWIAAAHGLADWTAVLPDARLVELGDGELVVGDAGDAPRRVPLPDGIGAALPVSAPGPYVVDEGQCIAPDYVTPAPQGGDVWVCNASELGFRLADADAELWITVEGGVRALRAPPSCAAIPLLRQNPIRGDYEVATVDAAFLREHAHATAKVEDDDYETVEPPSGWAPVGMLDRPAATAGCAILFLDETRQLRRFGRTGGEALVSDSSYGPIEAFGVSPDGRWVAIQHAGGRFVVRRAEPASQPGQAVRWATALRREDRSYQGIALAGGDGSGPTCLTSPNAESCTLQLRASPGVLGGFGEVFVAASRTGAEQIVVSNFPGFVVCQPDGVSVSCGEEFGVGRSPARAVAISADATRAAVAQNQGFGVQLFDLPVERNGPPRRRLDSFVATRLAFDGARLWLGGPAGLRLLDGDTDAEVDGARVEQLAVLGGGNRVVLEDGGGQLRLATIGAGVVGLGSLPQPATALAAAADEMLIAIGQPDGNLIFWDLERRSESARVALGGAIRSAVFRSDDRELWVATASGVAVLSTDREVLLRRTCEAARFSDADWQQIVDQPPPIDPCVPRGWLERVLAFARLQ